MIYDPVYFQDRDRSAMNDTANERVIVIKKRQKDLIRGSIIITRARYRAR